MYIPDDQFDKSLAIRMELKYKCVNDYRPSNIREAVLFINSIQQSV